jgi:putative transposase
MCIGRFFREQLWHHGDTYVLAGDETVVSKAGKHTHGLDRFFSSIYGKAIPGVSFFTLSLVSEQDRHAYPISVEQIVRTEAGRFTLTFRAYQPEQAILNFTYRAPPVIMEK